MTEDLLAIYNKRQLLWTRDQCSKGFIRIIIIIIFLFSFPIKWQKVSLKLSFFQYTRVSFGFRNDVDFLGNFSRPDRKIKLIWNLNFDGKKRLNMKHKVIRRRDVKNGRS